MDAANCFRTDAKSAILFSMTLPADAIRIEELELLARIGVTAEERAEPQRVVLCATLRPRRSFAEMSDDLRRTVNYAEVCQQMEQLVEERADLLLETLADAMARQLLARFEITRVELELRKFVLPQTKYVAVRVVREAE